MTRFIVILFFVSFVQGCTKDFALTDTVRIKMAIGKDAYIETADLRITQITDFWKLKDYFYGYHYKGNEYEMFIVDLKTNHAIVGESACAEIFVLGLPVDRWTNPAELFGEFVSDNDRRCRFLQNCAQ